MKNKLKKQSDVDNGSFDYVTDWIERNKDWLERNGLLDEALAANIKLSIKEVKKS